MIKVLRLAWIPRLLTPEIRNWKTIPDYCLRKTGGLNFLLRCNYDVKYIDGLPLLYKDILTFFSELKDLYCYNVDGTSHRFPVQRSKVKVMLLYLICLIHEAQCKFWFVITQCSGNSNF